MPTTVQVEQGVASWLEFQVLDADTGEPIVLIEDNQVRVWYKKHGELSFTQKTSLVTVADKNDPQPGENFVEVGFGWYAVYFTANDLDTLETFTWVVIPDDPGAQDFKQWNQQIDVVVSMDFISTIDDIDTTVTQTATDVTDGFTENETDIANVQTTVDDIDIKVDAMQSDVTQIKNNQPSGINVSFVEGG